jgi:hypothetical protein
VTNVYELAVPTQWAPIPNEFSHSTLRVIDECPRNWQLLHSQWGEQGLFPVRPRPEAVEGNIVHDANDRLMRALAARGLPSVGTPLFQEAVESVDFWNFFAAEVDKHNGLQAACPHLGQRFVVKTPPQQLANRAIRLLRERYVARNAPVPKLTTPSTGVPREVNPLQLLHSRGVVTECLLRHPTVPFVGVIDQVELTGNDVTIVDLKTGDPKPEHELQVRYYAVLWWRATGNLPASLGIQYLNRRVELRTSETELLSTERQLRASIDLAKKELSDRPAVAKVTTRCRYCPVRAHCTPGWTSCQAHRNSRDSDPIDIEVEVAARPVATGFAALVGPKKIDVVYDEMLGRLLPVLQPGQRLRLVDAQWQAEGTCVEIRVWTEVFVHAGAGEF